MSFPAARGDADYGTLNERAWPTFAQIDETLRGLRCEWLRPYRTTRRIPLQRTGAERVTVKWLPARLRALEARYPNRPRIVRQRVWTQAEQRKALRYRLNRQRERLDAIGEWRIKNADEAMHREALFAHTANAGIRDSDARWMAYYDVTRLSPKQADKVRRTYIYNQAMDALAR